MKKLYNTFLEHYFPPLGVELEYTEEFKARFGNITLSQSVVGKEYQNCKDYIPESDTCFHWKEACGSEGMCMMTIERGRVCLFRKGDIPIWKVK